MKNGNEKTDMPNQVKKEIEAILFENALKEKEIKIRAKKIYKRKNCLRWLTRMK